MVKILVAFPTQTRCDRFKAALEEAGYSVFRCCTSAAEVKRSINQCGEGVVISAFRLPDSTAVDMAEDLQGQASVLVMGKPDELANCDYPGIFRLPVPCARGELASAVSILMQMIKMRRPRRSFEERQLVEAAKQLLMTKANLSEPEAHHALQKGAMDRGMKLTDYATWVLRSV